MILPTNHNSYFNSINRLVFVMEMQNVLYAVGSEMLNIVGINFMLQRSRRETEYPQK
jgi:hypothetical protein